jgi:outer membrane lipoprotein carrier protein
MRSALLVTLLTLPALAATPAAPSTPNPAASLLAKVQAFYDRTQDLTADVDQQYAFHAMKRTLKASGTMQLRKPGLMRWDVAKPYAKQYLIDGQALYAYDSDDHEVVVKKDFSADSLSAAVTFLWGKGQLARDFDAAMVAKPEYGTNVIELTPRGPQAGFSKLYFDVEPASGLVRRSVVLDTEGNENRLTFSNVRTNTGLKAERFRFEKPQGATLTYR